MQEIKCPNCGEVFTIDEAGYAQIAQQVRDKEYEKDLANRLRELEEKNGGDLKIALMEQEKKFDKELTKKDIELTNKDREIERLKSDLEKAETVKELAVSKAIDGIKEDLSERNSEIEKLKGAIELQKKESEIKEKGLIEQHKEAIRLKDEQIEQIKDFKAKQSTKMVGESLEQYCKNQFDQIRMTAFPDAYFEKDNDTSVGGTKGDFIFKDYSDGTEFISIMFEMKNEMDETATKHKNEDFFKKLDKDRNDKNCEYAVLVSTLESDNDFYNNGIVDVSYKYPKMFVVRPQFFIPIISLLRNAAQGSIEYKKKLIEVQNQQVDLFNFENELQIFKTSFADSFQKATDRYEDAIDGIDKAIAALEKIKKNLLISEKHLGTANKKLEDVSIKRLTKNAPSVQEMFDEIQDKKSKKLADGNNKSK